MIIILAYEICLQWASQCVVDVTDTLFLRGQACQQIVLGFLIRNVSYAIKFLPIRKIMNVFWLMQPGSNCPTRVTWTICLEKYIYFVSCRPGLPKNSAGFFYKHLSYAIDYLLWILNLLWLLFWIMQAGNNETFRVTPSMCCR